MLHKQFIASYRGESDYTIGGKRYSVRHWGNDDGHYNGDYYATGIRPLIGCVRFHHYPDFHVFPSQEVMDLFPGFVAARLAHDTYAAEYINDAKPDLVLTSWGYEYPRWLAEQEWKRDQTYHHARTREQFGLASEAVPA